MTFTMSLVSARKEFELGLLELHVAARRNVEDEAEIDVDEVAEVVDEDVAVVPVLDLEQVGNDRVRRHRLDEVPLGDLEQVRFSA